jgi:hypothetical protein
MPPLSGVHHYYLICAMEIRIETRGPQRFIDPVLSEAT